MRTISPNIIHREAFFVLERRRPPTRMLAATEFRNLTFEHQPYGGSQIGPSKLTPRLVILTLETPRILLFRNTEFTCQNFWAPQGTSTTVLQTTDPNLGRISVLRFRQPCSERNQKQDSCPASIEQSSKPKIFTRPKRLEPQNRQILSWYQTLYIPNPPTPKRLSYLKSLSL